MPDDRVFAAINEAVRIVEEAQRKSIVLRIMGAVAFRIRCEKFGGLFDAMSRPITDIDFIGYRRHRQDMIKFFSSLGYVLDKEMLLLSERLKFHSTSGVLDVDVFLDELRMCHTILFKDQLEADYPTIPLVELLLEKMQIVRINEKDIKDTIVLLRAHSVATSEKDAVDPDRISKILADDWGFYHTVTMNLEKTRDFLSKYEALSESDVADVSSKIDTLISATKSRPKSARWKFRARVGTRTKWYEEVDERPAFTERS